MESGQGRKEKWEELGKEIGYDKYTIIERLSLLS